MWNDGSLWISGAFDQESLSPGIKLDSAEKESKQLVNHISIVIVVGENYELKKEKIPVERYKYIYNPKYIIHIIYLRVPS